MTDKNLNDTTEFIKNVPSKNIENQLDLYLDNVIKIDNTCCHKGCKQKTNLLGFDCKYCKNRYCSKHSLPEVHGCGDAVKNDERKKFLHPEPEKTKQQKANLQKAQKKLQYKLKNMQISRLPKPSNKNDKKGGASSSRTGTNGETGSTGDVKKRT